MPVDITKIAVGDKVTAEFVVTGTDKNSVWGPGGEVLHNYIISHTPKPPETEFHKGLLSGLYKIITIPT